MVHELKSVTHPSLAVVLDDHTLYTEAFSSFLERTGIFRHVYSFTGDDEFIEFLIRLQTKVDIYLFIDYYLKDKTALAAINDLKRLHRPLNIIIVSSVTNPVLINDILTYGINGFLSKSSNMDEVITCLQYIKQKKQYISPFIQNIITRNQTNDVLPFTGREIEILECFAKGLTVNATAEKMILSKHTIVSHRRRMMAKTKTNSITELLAYARKIDLI
jgi:two-component system, NarL family, response regulator FusR